jgi:plastocyanin
MTSIGIFVEKLGDNPQYPYTSVIIDGVKENYTLNGFLTFSVSIEGYGTGCGDTKAIITKENDSQFKSLEWHNTAQCVALAKPDHFEFNRLSGNTVLNETGSYTFTASFDDSTNDRHSVTEKKFSVIESKNNLSAQNTISVIIPPSAANASSGKTYEPQFLHLTIGVNNTVKWINNDTSLSSIIADNQDNPSFFAATNGQPSSQGSRLPNLLRPGESFEYTFTKVGYFGYHSEPHPWMRGWVLVLPQDTTNLLHQVVLNDTDVMGPCAIFEIPCPNTHTFTAQKFGTNIYIEKMTVNGVDYYAIVNPENYCVYPSNGYRNACTNSIDLTLLKLAG